MSLLQLNLSPDLLRLREAPYNVSIKAGYLVVRGIPYVNSAKAVCKGVLVSALELAGDRTAPPQDHTIMFSGEFPCHSDGTAMEMLRHQSVTRILDKGLEVHHAFSRKPLKGRYADYYEKVETYISLISREAADIDPSATALTRKVVEPEDEEYPFAYFDTASARAEINIVANKLATDKIAIIGLGGTGSYVLDLVAKTPVKEIHLFDADQFSTHNAFRAPGAATVEELRELPLKVVYFKSRYSKMNRRITAHEADISCSNVDLLSGMTFVFLCIDRGSDKKIIVEKLEEYAIPFIDVGMGLYRSGDSLGGKLRVTTSLPGRRDSAREAIPLSGDDIHNEYDKNIQIADLNSLNACLAVLRWKKLRGFYMDSEREQLTTYTIDFNLLMSEDKA
ncbi:MAG: ThiF family adenylyltransferase [Acidimicrobiaceae bacterium]|nr:ThiF family adenylyltransferase [Acidimicrobiaceae bacterium]